MTKADWIAVDWGTSTLRAWSMAVNGSVLAEATSDKGMNGLTPGVHGFEPALLELVEPWLSHGRVTDVIACGMVGARQGWVEADYRKVPASALNAEALTPAISQDPRLRVRVLSGICQNNPWDVMRGEETQIAGLLAAQPNFAGVVAMPGTHTKWVQIVDAEVFHFASFMTGELYALLATSSVLRHSVDARGFDAAAFAEALEESLARPERIAALLFGLRAEHLLKGADPAAAAGRLSGLLLGLELAGSKPYWLGQPIALVAAGRHAERYALALKAVGAEYTLHDPDACVLDGLRAARTHLLAPEGTA
jgi:2-dehydro-3-deoxygalactonokinase